ncbi:MAG: hypothetical protein NTX86_03340 [Candidatus Dependentiae bacterium]|nr:hypothetical protein [Candidatus Dependentiae bacterium]
MKNSIRILFSAVFVATMLTTIQQSFGMKELTKITEIQTKIDETDKHTVTIPTWVKKTAIISGFVLAGFSAGALTGGAIAGNRPKSQDLVGTIFGLLDMFAAGIIGGGAGACVGAAAGTIVAERMCKIELADGTRVQLLNFPKN